MTKKPGQTSAVPVPRRNPLLVALDVIAGALIILFMAVVALYILTTVAQFPVLQEACSDGPYDGVVCNPVFLNIVIIVISAITVFAGFIGAGMFVVRLIRKRVAFLWPLITLVIMVAGFYVGTYLISLAVPMGAAQ